MSLLAVTLALVVVALVTLVIGFFVTPGFLYVSIACCLVAGAVLLVFTRVSRREAVTGAPVGAPAPAGPPPPPPPAPVQEPAPAPEPAPVPAYEPPPLPADAGAGAATAVATAPTATAVDEAEFPIADYDDLRVSEILPLLPELELDELYVVRDREQQGKNRSAVIGRIDDLIADLEAEEGVAPAAVPPAPVGEPEEGFPIADYAELTTEQILPLLEELDDDELEMVADREEQGQNRAVVLDTVDDLLERVPVGAPAVPAEPVEPVEERATRKVAAKKARAKKVPAKKALVTKAAKKAPAKKVTAKKVTVAKAPAKKVTAKRVPAKKVLAKKGPGRKVPAKKLLAKKVPARKAPAKKVAATAKKG